MADGTISLLKVDFRRYNEKTEELRKDVEAILTADVVSRNALRRLVALQQRITARSFKEKKDADTGRAWPPLSPNTANTNESMLIRSGALYNSAVASPKESEIKKESNGSWTATIGFPLQPSYAILQQTGTAKMPARPFFALFSNNMAYGKDVEQVLKIMLMDYQDILDGKQPKDYVEVTPPSAGAIRSAMAQRRGPRPPKAAAAPKPKAPPKPRPVLGVKEFTTRARTRRIQEKRSYRARKAVKEQLAQHTFEEFKAAMRSERASPQYAAAPNKVEHLVKAAAALSGFRGKVNVREGIQLSQLSDTALYKQYQQAYRRQFKQEVARQLEANRQRRETLGQAKANAETVRESREHVKAFEKKVGRARTVAGVERALKQETKTVNKTFGTTVSRRSKGSVVKGGHEPAKSLAERASEQMRRLAEKRIRELNKATRAREAAAKATEREALRAKRQQEREAKARLTASEGGLSSLSLKQLSDLFNRSKSKLETLKGASGEFKTPQAQGRYMRQVSDLQKTLHNLATEFKNRL